MTYDEVDGADTEADLLRQARAGNDEALGRLYADHVQDAVRYARSLAGDDWQTTW